MAVGAIVTTVLGLYLDVPGVVLLPLIFIGSFVAGGIWSGVSGWLKTRFGVHEILSTLRRNYIALKLLGMHRAVNVTLGLPIIRTSVAHGTAFDLAWQARAELGSMLEAIRVASRLAGVRREG